MTHQNLTYGIIGAGAIGGMLAYMPMMEMLEAELRFLDERNVKK